MANMIIEVRSRTSGRWVRWTVTYREYVKMHVAEAKEAGYEEVRVREK